MADYLTAVIEKYGSDTAYIAKANGAAIAATKVRGVHC
jgi:hypothetical protein